MGEIRSGDYPRSTIYGLEGLERYEMATLGFKSDKSEWLGRLFP